MLITFTDVSDMVQREEETLLYRAALEQMPVPVFIRDTNRRMIYVNTPMRSFTGSDERTSTD